MVNQATSLYAILRNKEERALRQKTLLAQFCGSSLISLSINIPGSVKLTLESLVIFEEALEALMQKLDILHLQTTIAVTGAEAIVVSSLDPLALKKLTCKIETEHPLGRLMDMDVIDAKGNILSRSLLGYAKRQCFVCEADAFVCGRTQKHPITELQQAISSHVRNNAFKSFITQCCVVAMQKEVELTPKPGLVDRDNNGAHKDMDIHTFYASIKAIQPFIGRFLEANSFEKLRQIGIMCEKTMFDATKGVNTHKGMIFCLALVCGAIGTLNPKSLTCKALQEAIKILCPNLIDKDLIQANPHTAGARFFYETGSLGIRGEAQSGFATIFEHSLPFFMEQRELLGEDMALKKTLLLLMSILDDSTLWSRGGVEGLAYVKENSAKILLHVKPDTFNEALQAFDEELIARNLSGGGSADLLALTWLIAHIVEN